MVWPQNLDDEYRENRILIDQIADWHSPVNKIYQTYSVYCSCSTIDLFASIYIVYIKTKTLLSEHVK